MKWIFNFLMSSIGKKVIMSLTGLFLCSFLVIHMLGNLQLFLDLMADTPEEEGLIFNAYAYKMTHSPLIKTISYGLYFFIILHALQGIMIVMQNKSAVGGGKRYSGREIAPTEAHAASRNMIWLGVLILAFIGLHMVQFWGYMHFGGSDYWAGTYTMANGTVINMTDAEGHKNLYLLVKLAFQNWMVVLFYLISLVALALHLLHGFQSAFQTLGLNHKKYTPIIKGLGVVFSIVVPLAFAMMPIVFFMASLGKS